MLQLVDWIHQAGGICDKINIKEQNIGGNGNEKGAFACTDISENQQLLCIPLSCLITVQRGEESVYGRRIIQAQIPFRYVIYLNIIIIRMKYKNVITRAPRHVYLAIFLLQDQSNSTSSFFTPYYETLPQELNHMPIFWKKDELRYLQGSYILDLIKIREKEYKVDYDSILAVSNSSH